MTTFKICPSCKESFPATFEFFHRRRKIGGGIHSYCKTCDNKSSHEWSIAHRQRCNEKAKRYRSRHPERVKLIDAKSKDKRRLNGKAKLTYDKRKKSGRAREAEIRHLQKLKAAGSSPHKRMKINHPETYANRTRRKILDRQDMKRYGLTAIGIYARDGGKCHLCHRKVSRKSFSLDHIVPKSKGGPGSWENLALAHLRCNMKRGVDRIPAQYRLF